MHVAEKAIFNVMNATFLSCVLIADLTHLFLTNTQASKSASYVSRPSPDPTLI